MINIYNSTENNFKHNGLCVLDNCIICEVEEELNGFYGLELEYPIFDTKAKYLIEDNIIKAPTPTGSQLFRIYRKVKNMSTITIYARHIFYDLVDNFIESYRTGNVDGNTALKGILVSTQYPNNFKAYSNISNIADAYYVRKNPVETLIGDNKNSFINRWGGELKRDNFNISILNSIGADKGVTIAYGKNLIGIEEDLDMSEVATRIIPTGLDEKDNIVILPEKYIDSSLIEKYPKPKVRHLHFGDIKVNPEENITLEDVKKQLRDKVQELYQIQQIDIPNVNYTVDFVELSKTQEYKNYKCLETVNLGDIVTVKHKKLGVDIKQKVIKYRWDSILGKYLEIELGNLKDNLSRDINNLSNSIEEVKENMQETKKKFRSKIDKQDDRITLTVEEIDKTNAKLEITANEINTSVDDKINEVNSNISQTATEIRTEVNDTKNELNSNISQTASNVEMSVKGYVNDEVSDTKRYAESKINVQADRIDMLSDKVNINGTYFYSDGTMQTEGLRGDVINFNYGYSIDNRNGGIRLKYDDRHYISVRSNGIAFYVGGEQKGLLDSDGFHNVRNGKRYPLTEGAGKVEVIPVFG